jgi:hypothetical protein
MNVLMSNRLHWTRLLAFVTGLVNQELVLRNEYWLRIASSAPTSIRGCV